jgi:ribokinase
VSTRFVAQPERVIAVLGSINLDSTMIVDQVPADGETVIAISGRRGLGGKGANQAVAAARAGARVRLIGAVGSDADGRDAIGRLNNLGVDVSKVRTISERTSGSASVWLTADAENRIVVLPGANADVSPEQAVEAVQSLAAGDLLVAQAEIPSESVVAALEAARECGIRTVLNLAPVIDIGTSIRGADPLVINEIELGQLMGTSYASVDEVLADTARVAALAISAVVTLGAQGAIVFEKGTATHVPAEPAGLVVDMTGAGDAFVGVLAARIGVGDSVAKAAMFAVRCATEAIAVLGAADSYPDFRQPIAELEGVLQ